MEQEMTESLLSSQSHRTAADSHRQSIADGRSAVVQQRDLSISIAAKEGAEGSLSRAARRKLRAQTYKDEHYSCCGSRLTLPGGTKGEWASRYKWLKRHTSSFLSIASILLNIIIVSRLLPDLRSDVTFMQGQTSELSQSVQGLQSQVSSVLAGVTGQIHDVEQRIDTFNAHMDATEAKFNATEEHITHTLAAADSTLELLQNSSTAAVAAFTDAQLVLAQQFNASIEVMSAVNASTVNTAQKFAVQVIPDFVTQMQGLNVTQRLDELDVEMQDVQKSVFPNGDVPPLCWAVGAPIGTGIISASPSTVHFQMTQGCHPAGFYSTSTGVFSISVSGVYAISAGVSITSSNAIDPAAYYTTRCSISSGENNPILESANRELSITNPIHGCSVAGVLMLGAGNTVSFEVETDIPNPNFVGSAQGNMQQNFFTIAYLHR